MPARESRQGTKERSGDAFRWIPVPKIKGSSLVLDSGV